ncbi:unnamed protein product [Plutella xylostella]|uniref:(diamondback moth) hypothetical protein n=1 Tax=Plutella xylostella TaxID=51655 RepID=A0A8S4EW29_PLUXY|nr:unnamed protein product [Plutella xylostella]
MFHANHPKGLFHNVCYPQASTMGPATLLLPCLLLLSSSSSPAQGQNIERRLGPLREVFAWKQLTFDINGHTCEYYY